MAGTVLCLFWGRGRGTCSAGAKGRACGTSSQHLASCVGHWWPLELALPRTFTGLQRWTDLAEGLVKWFGSRQRSEMKKDLGRQCCDLLAVRGSLG